MRSREASSVEKALAVLQGAAEGFVEQSKESNLPALVGATIDTVKESVQAVRGELPRKPAAQGGASAGGEGGNPEDIVLLIEGARAQQTPMPLADRAEQAVGRLETYAESLRVAAERAAEAPALIRYEVRSTMKETSEDLKAAAVGYSATAVLGLFALAFLSIVIAVALNRAFGDPWGWLIVGLLYAIGAAVMFSKARTATRDVKERTRQGVENVRGEVRNVKDTVRNVGRPGAGA